jgi:radical SAM superfamily enzyme YgiQ (UPF0313 family)
MPVLVISAFDRRTRMLPFILWDRQIVPAGARAISAALAVAGFASQRTVNQAWTPHLRPSCARINGKPPELLLVSAMQIHSAAAYSTISDAYRLGADRPLIIAGGPKAIYQPWDYFAFDKTGHSADIVCTGEEYVLLDLLDRLSECRRQGETYRAAFERARRRGWLEDIPGLMFDRSAEPDRHELVDTGVQRLVRDFDELPSPVLGYQFLERPHSGHALYPRPLTLREIRRYSRVASITTTRGCKFRCGYCPIPAYNQFTFRTRSPKRLVRDISDLRREVGFHLFFGTDDNFFNDRETVEVTFEALARAGFEKDDIGRSVRFGTEATEYDVHKQMDLLPLCYRGGLRAVWFGIEDITAELINKGQSVGKTQELFAELRRQRIMPMAMIMHYDGQPLWTRDSHKGLLNQVRLLHQAGAASIQVTVLTPAVGTKDFDPVMESGIILSELGGRRVDDWLFDGNHVVSIGSSKPARMQANVLAAYALFYNPLNVARWYFRKHRKWAELFIQFWGMWGLFHTILQLVPWIMRLGHVARGRYQVFNSSPQPRWPVVAKPISSGSSDGARRAAWQPPANAGTATQKAKITSRRPSLSRY